MSKKKNYPGSAWRAMAAQVYDDLASDTGSATFDKTDVVELVKDRLMEAEGAVEELCWAAAEGLVRDIDDHRTAPAKPDFLFDLDGVYALGDGLRVSKKAALVDHGQQALLNRTHNAKRAMDALHWNQEEFNRLWPKWKEPGVTKEQAVDWWTAQSESDA